MNKTHLDIAIVGHTNAGKTSLMRTLTRQRHFGEVSSRPATTRHVEMAEIGFAGMMSVRLYDTPGLEDSIGLLAYLDKTRKDHDGDWTAAIDALQAEHEGGFDFAQEAKALNQVRQSDVALYIVDVRDRVRERHRDELEILGRCAVPVLPVLNFIKDMDAHEDAWRNALARVNMHAVIAFDTVIYDEAGELALYKKIATLKDKTAPALDRLVADLRARRRRAHRTAAGLVADLLIDAAAAFRDYSVNDELAKKRAIDELRDKVRERERGTVSALLELMAFAPDDYRLHDLPIAQGVWQDDLFDPAMLSQMGLSAGRAAAAGAAAGVAVDLMVGGLTLGAAAATGAAIGFVIDTARKHGDRIMGRLGGRERLRLDDATLALLAARQIWLIKALMQRGHGATTPLDGMSDIDGKKGQALLPLMRKARGDVRWSGLNDGQGAGSAGRAALHERLSEKIISLGG